VLLYFYQTTTFFFFFFFQTGFLSVKSTFKPFKRNPKHALIWCPKLYFIFSKNLIVMYLGFFTVDNVEDRDGFGGDRWWPWSPPPNSKKKKIRLYFFSFFHSGTPPPPPPFFFSLLWSPHSPSWFRPWLRTRRRVIETASAVNQIYIKIERERERERGIVFNPNQAVNQFDYLHNDNNKQHK
jgi:hypothetical protein